MDTLFTVQLAVTQRILNTTVSAEYAQSRGPLCQTAFFVGESGQGEEKGQEFLSLVSEFAEQL